MTQPITRRAFVQNVGMAGAALAALPACADSAPPAEQRGTVTLALVGCAHSHTPGCQLRKGRRQANRQKSLAVDGSFLTPRPGPAPHINGAKVYG